MDERTIRTVLGAANVVDVIGDFYELRKSGREWECLCPFHDDRHLGSFKVNEEKNLWMCFSCGAYGDSVEFLIRHEGLSFPDAIRWLGRKYGIEVEGSERFNRVRPATPRPKPEPLPALRIPTDVMKKTLHYDNNVLVGWLKSLNWDYAQRSRIDKMLRNYLVGTTKEGATIWWQADENGVIRTGKIMRYLSDGHRDKTGAFALDWVHAVLERAGHLGRVGVDKTLFGMHLLDLCPHATVNIVESEKTALIMAIAYGDMQSEVWMASGGLRQITRDKLRPIIQRGRDIVLYPDRDGVEAWQEMADGLKYDRLKVYTDPVKLWWTKADGDKADIGDIIVRWLGEPPVKNVKPVGEVVENVLENMIKKNEVLGELVESLNLKEV